MLKNEREDQILDYLKTNRYASVKLLSDMLFASESSIRRDLDDLEMKGFIRRSYGGAELVDANTSILPFSTRSYDSVEAKQKIAAKAAKLVKSNDVVFLDQSSTSYFLARAIMDMKAITVVTNNLEILHLLSRKDMCVISSGGKVSKENNNCLIGQNAGNAFEEIHGDIMFFSAKAISGEGAIWDCTQEEVFVRKAMLQNAERKVFLCDSSKFNAYSAYKQCSLKDVDYMIAENHTAQQYQEKFPKLYII